MIVTSSRLHAVRYKLALDTYLRNNYPSVKSLVAFSGTVNDDKEFTEENMNDIKSGELVDKFDKDNDIKFLIVAEKYQTGFDQPKLCAMYVDKALDGVKAVQTLSRLNRTFPEKDNTFILDFFNETSTIIKSFEPYFQQTNVEDLTDPNLVLDTLYQLNKIPVYINEELDQFANLFLKEKRKNTENNILNNIIDKGVNRFSELVKEQQEEFKVLAVKYIRIYNFLIQIYPLKNIELYKLQIYLVALLKKLPKDELMSRLDLDNILTLDLFKIEQISGKEEKGEDISLGKNSDSEDLTGFTGGGSSRGKEPDFEHIDDLIKKINELFGLNLTNEDKVGVIDPILMSFLKSDEVKNKVKANSFNEFRESFEKDYFLRELLKRKKSNEIFFNNIMKNQELKKVIMDNMVKELYKNQ